MSVKSSVNTKRKLDEVSAEGDSDRKRAKVKGDKKTRRSMKAKR